jgi:hypothetical protein
MDEFKIQIVAYSSKDGNFVEVEENNDMQL